MCLHTSPCSAAITIASYVNPSATQNQCSLSTRFPLLVTPTAPSALFSSLFNTTATFQQQQQQQLLQQPQNLSPISSNQSPETIAVFSELNAAKESALNASATCYPLLPSLESLLPLTLLQLDQQVSNSIFTPQTSPAYVTSALTSNHKIAETKSFQQSAEWLASVRRPLATTHLHRQPSVNENNSDHQNSMRSEIKRLSDFSINRLLRKHCAGSTLNKRSDTTTSNGHQHDERSGKGRKQRTIYGVSQTKILEKAFEEQQYMVGTEREMLAERLGLSEAQVRVWFQNRRSKWRKQLRANVYVQ
ncbi:homeobox domain protein [Onchocerca flexuosa]|uniref:Homeobox domain protein n=2 Tax=Onchocerca flexuosa TaxID=387005 RepID=A0A183H8T5_9BILA|nr:homeobox domain protein [Onchocerca flexuosa]OZC09567.1 homeobox domain protein [Onchocerca flexuosa]VDO38135.1 unnamed protein product [Onchocerca flexuosa]